MDVLAEDGLLLRFGSFFTISEAGLLTCADRPPASRRWLIDREPIEVYLKRVCSLEAQHFVNKFTPRGMVPRKV